MPDAARQDEVLHVSSTESMDRQSGIFSKPWLMRTGHGQLDRYKFLGFIGTFVAYTQL